MEASQEGVKITLSPKNVTQVDPNVTTPIASFTVLLSVFFN